MTVLDPVEPLPTAVREPPGPPRPPAPPTTGEDGDPEGHPLRPPHRPPRPFLHEVVVEMRKVAWPTRGDILHNAAIYLGALVLLIGAIAAANPVSVALIPGVMGAD